MRKKTLYSIFILLSLSALFKSCSFTPETEPREEDSKIANVPERIIVPIKNPCPKLGALDKETFKESVSNLYGEENVSIIIKDGVDEKIKANLAFNALDSAENKSEFLDLYSRICGKDNKEYLLYEKQFLALEERKKKDIELANIKVKENYKACIDKFTEQALIQFQIHNKISRHDWETQKKFFSDKLCKVSLNQKESCEEDMEACLKLIPKYNQLTYKYSPIFDLAIIELFSLDRSKEDFIVYGDNVNTNDSAIRKKLALYQSKCTEQFGKKFMDYATLNVSELVNLFFSFKYTQNPGHNGFTLVTPNFKHNDIEEIMCQKSLDTDKYDDCSFDVKTCALVSLKTFEINNKYDKIKK